MKSTIATIAILALVGLVIGVGVSAGTTASVSATVTAELITISVDNGVVVYGTLAVNTSKDTVSPSQTQVVTNNGTVDVNLGVKSSDADGGTGWNLVSAVGNLDEYTHEYSSDGGTGWATFNVNNATYATLGLGNIAASGGTQNLDTKITTPTSVTDGTEKTITVTILATKS